MKIATWNIGGGFVYSEDSSAYDVLDLDYFISVLRYVNADVICLQEVHYMSEENNQAAQIANALGMHHVVFPHAISHLDSSCKLSVAILSKGKLSDREEKLFFNPNVVCMYKGKEVYSMPKGMVSAVAPFQGRDVRVVSGHNHTFMLFEGQFSAEDIVQFKEDLVEFVSQSDLPTVAGFDLNFEDHNSYCNGLLEKGFVQLVPSGVTMPKHNTPLDKIFVSKEWKLVPGSAKILSDGKADHFLCVAEVEL